MFCPHAYIGPYVYGMSYMRMGYPVRIWDNIMSHTCMGVPHKYTFIAILHALQASIFVYKMAIS